MHRRHPDIVHQADPETHRDRARADAQGGRSRGVRDIDARAHNDHADEKRQQCRQNEIIDRAGEIRRQHGDEMHRPDARRQCQRSSGQREAPAKSFRAVQFPRQRKADEAALNGNPYR
jgi:hypothetical protein